MSMYVVFLHFKHFFFYLFPLMNSQNFVYRRLVPKNSNNFDPIQYFINPLVSRCCCFTIRQKEEEEKNLTGSLCTLWHEEMTPHPTPLRPYRECVCMCERLCECVNERPDGKYPPSHYSLSLSQQQQQHNYPPEILSPTFLIFFGKQFRFDFVNLGFISISFWIIFFAFINTWYHGFVYILVFSFSLGVTKISKK
jgi:hypothetical protein